MTFFFNMCVSMCADMGRMHVNVKEYMYVHLH